LPFTVALKENTGISARLRPGENTDSKLWMLNTSANGEARRL